MNTALCGPQVAQWDADAEKATAEANKEAHVAVNLQKQVLLLYYYSQA